MPRPTLTPHRRRVLTLRHREAAWQASLDVLFDRDGRSLFYALCLAKEGYGTRTEAFEAFEEHCEELLVLMREARPEEADTLETRWRTWLADRPGRPEPDATEIFEAR
jgi:hypothetical protein